MKQSVIDLKGKVVKEVELPEKVFGVKWNPELVRQVLLSQLANRRHPWAHAKGRGEVRGGGRKPWRQKGTGRARHGSIRSPIWIGGGKAHGPSKERNYSQKVNKKMNRLAILCVLSKKFKEAGVKVVDQFKFDPAKTKTVATNLRVILDLNKNDKKFDTLLITQPENKEPIRLTRNLTKTKTLSADSLNVYDLLNHKNILIEESGIASIQKHYKTVK